MSRSSASRLTADEVGAAGEIEGQTECSEVLEQGPDGVNEEGYRERPCRSTSAGGAGADVRLEAPQVFVLIGERVGGLSAALADSLGELNHLVNRLLAVQSHDVVENEAPEVVAGLAGLRRQRLDEHGHHDFGPSLADQRYRAVEVEEDVADLFPGREGNGQLDAGPIGVGFQVIHLGGGFWVGVGGNG